SGDGLFAVRELFRGNRAFSAASVARRDERPRPRILSAMPAPQTLAIQAPAKLNLALSVGPPAGPRGMHPICSWMITVNLFDDLLLTRLEDDRLSRYAILWHPEAKRRTDIDWSITRDLAVRAHLALEQHVDRKLPLQM